MAESVESFKNRINHVVIDGFLTYGLAIGHQLRLFDTMAEFDEFESIDTIARKANCKARYIEEWLKMMVVSHVVEIDPTETKYFLPTHRRPALVSTTSSCSFDLSLIPVITLHHEGLLECFKTNGPYCLTPPAKVDEIIGSRTTNEYWQYVLDQVFKPYAPEFQSDLERGVSFCDMGCASGTLVLFLARLFHNSKFVGIDIVSDYIDQAKAKSNCQHNAEFFIGNVMEAETTARFSVQFDYILMSLVFHDLEQPLKAAKEMWHMLKPGGRVLLLEFDMESSVRENAAVPQTTVLYGYSLYYCLSSALLSENSQCLGTVAGKGKFKSLLTEAGFRMINVYSIGDENRTLLVVAEK